jgi:hypothetical protein
MDFSDPTQRNCMTCGKESPTWALTYHQNIGILAMHIRKSTPMQVCRSCVHKEYWKRFAILITVGWTSYYSIVIGPVLLIMNTATYIKNLTGKPTATPEALPAAAAAPLPPPAPSRHLPPSL